MLDQRLHEEVNIPKLLFVGGLVKTIAEGQSALAKGKVFIESWNIGIGCTTLPRWVLRGVSLRVHERSMQISEDGSRILRESPRESVLA